MPPSQGVRPDLATRLRQSQPALTDHLASPARQLALLHAAHETLEPQKIGDLVVDRVTGWLRATSCAVVATDTDGHIVTVAGRGLTAHLSSAAIEVARWVMAHGRHFATSNLRRDDRVQGACGAVIAVPLRCRARTMGALVVLERTATPEAPLGDVVAELLASVLEGPAVALDNALALRRAEALSVTDDLTQLYNSRYLHQALRREVKRTLRTSRPLSLLFLDLDGFKGVNDVHGHLAGSRALVEAAQLIRASARETDVAARFGGDEFSVVLPDTASAGAAAVAERLKNRVAAHVFLAEDALDIRLTVSVGVATLPDVASTAEELLKAADTAMYRIKGSGKNGVFVARSDSAAD